jgi:two-component system response regulator AtoC
MNYATSGDRFRKVAQGNYEHFSSFGPPQTSAEFNTTGTRIVENLGDNNFFVAASGAMKKVRERAELVARVDVPLLLLGETGTGKEVLARLVHKRSARAHRRFWKVNCAALPSELLESELFGYEPGAFTGATRSKPGQFELSDHGTIFLDEVGELPPALQAKLLQVLQDGEFCRLGGRSPVHVDVRVVAATNVNVTEALAAGKLREDLYYRLSAFSLHLPALRERRADISVLFQFFMNRHAQQLTRTPLPVSAALLEACASYPWPGNVRELENLVRRYLVLGEEDRILQELASGEVSEVHHRARGPEPDGNHGNLKAMVRSVKRKVEMRAIARALEEANGAAPGRPAG